MVHGGPCLNQPATYSGKLNHLTGRLDKMDARIDKHDSRLKEAEGRTLTLEDSTAVLSRKVAKMETELKQVVAENEDFESRYRRNNLCIIGVAETTSMGKPEDFVEHLLTDLFGRNNFSPCLIMETAHRSLGPRPPAGAPPCPIIACLLNYKDRDNALRMARENGDLHYQKFCISLFPDFAIMVQEARRAYTDGKKWTQGRA